MLELTFKMKSEMRKIICHECLAVVHGKVFFMEMKGALVHFLSPTKDNHFICDECKEKKK